jgi:uncharacterized protein YlaI
MSSVNLIVSEESQSSEPSLITTTKNEIKDEKGDNTNEEDSNDKNDEEVPIVDDEKATEEEEIEWHSKGGLVANVGLLVREFVTVRKLQPVTIAIGGASSEGVGRTIAELYGLPIVSSRAQIISENACKFRGWCWLGDLLPIFAPPKEVSPADEEGGVAEKAEEEGGSSVIAATVMMVGGAIEPSLWALVGADVPVFEVEEEEKMVSKMCIFIERHGKPNNFLEEEEVEDAASLFLRSVGMRRGSQKRLSSKRFSRMMTRMIEFEGTTVELTNEEKSEDARRLAHIETHQIKTKKLHEMPLREYLLEHCVPGVVEALETLRRAKEMTGETNFDPLQFLADFLEDRNNLESSN